MTGQAVSILIILLIVTFSFFTLFFCSIALMAFADDTIEYEIVLKNNRSLNVPAYEKIDGQYCFYKSGGKVCISESEVVRVREIKYEDTKRPEPSKKVQESLTHEKRLQPLDIDSLTYEERQTLWVFCNTSCHLPNPPSSVEKKDEYWWHVKRREYLWELNRYRDCIEACYDLQLIYLNNILKNK